MLKLGPIRVKICGAINLYDFSYNNGLQATKLRLFVRLFVQNFQFNLLNRIFYTTFRTNSIPPVACSVVYTIFRTKPFLFLCERRANHSISISVSLAKQPTLLDRLFVLYGGKVDSTRTPDPFAASEVFSHSIRFHCPRIRSHDNDRTESLPECDNERSQ